MSGVLWLPHGARAETTTPSGLIEHGPIAYGDVIAVAPDQLKGEAQASDPIAYEAVLSESDNRPASPRSAGRRAHSPVGRDSEIEAPAVSRNSAKLLLTNGIASVEGTSGGGVATWATIAGREMDRGIGLSAHFTAIELPDYGWRSYGASIGIADRLELSYARNNFDTRAAGAALGLGQGFTFNQDVFAAKVKVLGDAVYGSTLVPQIAIGAEYKRNLDRDIVALLGAGDHDGVDYTVSATKLFLEHSVLANATARYTKANQLGLLGFGGPADGYKLQFEGSLAYQLSRRAVVGAEYRSKPDNLGLGEDDWLDVFAAYTLTDNITLSAAYVDLGSIATFEEQRGGFVQAQVAF
ncbi:MAG: DUF3034 family protein [Pseudomonadota bacterium]|nr:DUF3034 family protein [Pseudomonadota bacterium]